MKLDISWVSKVIKAIGGGPGSKKFFSLVFLYVVALVTSFSKWAHFTLNSRRLPRYDATKLGRFRVFSVICMGKSPKIVPDFKRDAKI